jgi:hypothetical protein
MGPGKVNVMPKPKAFIIADVSQAVPANARRATVTLADGEKVSTVVDRKHVASSGGEDRLEVTCYRCGLTECEVRLPGVIEDGHWAKVTLGGKAMCTVEEVA